MTAADASVLLIVLLAGFCVESFAAGGWTEVVQAETYQYSSYARFAYLEQRPPVQGLTFFVTQVRWMVSTGTVYNIGFNVLRNNVMLERCVTILWVPPVYTLARRQILNFWCTPVV
ncbi:hypothetical protein MTO96_029102 [Rhipicephalus appendiculatus]